MTKIRQLSRVAQKTGAKSINWFPGHMYAGMKAMIGKLATVDCVVEVHDARIPLTGRNREFRQHLGAIKPHILVLNKADLADLSNWNNIKKKLEERGDNNILLTDLKGRSANEDCIGHYKLMNNVVSLINQSDRYNRTTLNYFQIMIVGIPNVGKSTLINRLRQYHLGLGGDAAVTGKLAGVTRNADKKIKICSRPLVYSIDTPGVLEPSSTRSHYKAMQLALCASIRDDILNSHEVGTYLLKYFNEKDPSSYMNLFGLPGPVNSVEELFRSAMSEECQKNAIIPFESKTLDLDNFCWHFIKGFREGVLGLVMFD